MIFFVIFDVNSFFKNNDEIILFFKMSHTYNYDECYSCNRSNQRIIETYLGKVNNSDPSIRGM